METNLILEAPSIQSFNNKESLKTNDQHTKHLKMTGPKIIFMP